MKKQNDNTVWSRAVHFPRENQSTCSSSVRRGHLRNKVNKRLESVPSWAPDIRGSLHQLMCKSKLHPRPSAPQPPRAVIPFWLGKGKETQRPESRWPRGRTRHSEGDIPPPSVNISDFVLPCEPHIFLDCFYQHHMTKQDPRGWRLPTGSKNKMENKKEKKNVLRVIMYVDSSKIRRTVPVVNCCLCYLLFNLIFGNTSKHQDIIS